MRAFILMIAMIASCTPARAQVTSPAATGKATQPGKPSTQQSKQRSIVSENSSRQNSNLNGSNRATGNNAGSRTVAARHSSAPPNSATVRHLNGNAAIVGGPANTNKSGGGALNGTAMKRKP
jgi:hypothetical protein